MSTKAIKIAAATAMTLSLGTVAAPMASAHTTPSVVSPSNSATPVGGSVVLCFPLGSVAFCI